MIMKPYAAFGSAVVMCYAEPSDEFPVKMNDYGLSATGNFLFLRGSAKVIVKETGEKLKDRTPGWFNLQHQEDVARTRGTMLLQFDEPTEWLCVPYDLNSSGLPTTQMFSLEAGKSDKLPNYTNLFLARGEVKVNDKVFTAPCQIRVRSGDCTITSNFNETSYGLIMS
jgi:hypothetical protein